MSGCVEERRAVEGLVHVAIGAAARASFHEVLVMQRTYHGPDAELGHKR